MPDVVRNFDFAERRDCVRYFHDTVCRYKQEFVRVTCDNYDFESVNDIFIRPFGGKDKKVKIKCTDGAFSVYMPELGYVNTKEGAFYLKRKPLRDQKGGLSPQYLTFHGTRKPFAFSTSIIFEDCGLAMLENRYPTFTEADASIEYGVLDSVAFAKHLCVRLQNRWTKVIDYRGETAAIYDNRVREWYIPQPRSDTSFIKAILLRNGVEVK